ncbi:UDP-N-acetylglucosamine 2-epimerase (hydrolyzing) [Candidatus Bipolaricaulota bacterium]|nr:UDP-N-acetylglucosamine 2-epimerase (hydrolyzing) [Candidatus Bipolaricaulota bacterium]
MRTIGVVTTSRADYGIYLPILREIVACPDLQLHLIVSGMHLSPEFGLTVRNIEADGFAVSDRVEMLLSSDSPEGVAKGMGMGLIGFSQIFARSRPDILLVLGDRFEMHSAALAALPFKIPVGHIHGGELTEGAIDDALRHSMTKLSHLHFVSTEEYAQRIIQMGEEPWRVVVTGAPSLDNLATVEFLDREELSRRTGVPVEDAFLLVTFHPATMEFEHATEQAVELAAALEAARMPVLITMPNADTGGRAVRDVFRSWAARSGLVKLVENLGTQAYFSAMHHAAAMVGNSSSGIVEATSFGLPVVNVGSRQIGRVRGRNVIDVGNSRDEILHGTRRALDPSFRESLCGLKNPYGDGGASERIVETLGSVDLAILSHKRFHDLT